MSINKRAYKENKIVFVCNELGSFDRHRSYLAEYLNLNEFECVLYSDRKEKFEKKVAYIFRHLNIERFRFAPIFDAIMFVTILFAIFREKPRVLHLINIKPYLYGGLAANCARLFGWRGKLVITVAGLGRLYDPESLQSLDRRIRRGIVESALRLSTRDAAVTFETGHDRDFWISRKLITAEQATVVNGTGVNLSAFAPGPRNPDQCQLRVLYAGRLLRSKGLEVYLEAASIIKRDKKPLGIEMLVAGFEENDPDSISASLLRENKDIEYIGTVSDMPSLLRGVDIVALPTRYNEGVPRILIEAAATGCIPISTQFPGSDMLIKDNVTGHFIRKSHDVSLAENLVQLILKLNMDPELRKVMSQNAIDHVNSHGFCESEILMKFLELYGLRHKGSKGGTTTATFVSSSRVKHDRQLIQAVK